MEENLRRALLISRGDWSVFLTRPLSAVLMAIAACLLVLPFCRRCARSATRCSSSPRTDLEPTAPRGRRSPKPVRADVCD
jgi:TctA family transporter